METKTGKQEQPPITKYPYYYVDTSFFQKFHNIKVRNWVGGTLDVYLGKYNDDSDEWVLSLSKRLRRGQSISYALSAGGFPFPPVGDNFLLIRASSSIVGYTIDIIGPQDFVYWRVKPPTFPLSEETEFVSNLWLKSGEARAFIIDPSVQDILFWLHPM